MNESWKSQESSVAPEQAVGAAIQDLTATRLGRGFLPLALLGITGIVQTVLGAPGAATLALGALGAGVAMLAYGLRVTQNAFGREHRLWMSIAMLGSIVPPAFALYVLAWLGLRGFVVGSGALGLVAALYFLVVGSWAMRSWMRVVEVERLARAMAIGSSGGDR